MSKPVYKVLAAQATEHAHLMLRLSARACATANELAEKGGIDKPFLDKTTQAPAEAPEPEAPEPEAPTARAIADAIAPPPPVTTPAPAAAPPAPEAPAAPVAAPPAPEAPALPVGGVPTIAEASAVAMEASNHFSVEYVRGVQAHFGIEDVKTSTPDKLTLFVAHLRSELAKRAAALAAQG